MPNFIHHCCHHCCHHHHHGVYIWKYKKILWSSSLKSHHVPGLMGLRNRLETQNVTFQKHGTRCRGGGLHIFGMLVQRDGTWTKYFCNIGSNTSIRKYSRFMLKTRREFMLKIRREKYGRRHRHLLTVNAPWFCRSGTWWQICSTEIGLANKSDLLEGVILKGQWASDIVEQFRGH